MAASRGWIEIAVLWLLLGWMQAAYAAESELDRARTMVRDGQYSTAIVLLEKLSSNDRYAHQAEAMELLGVAREKNGQLAQAKLVYRQYLQRFPKSPGARRVEQRLSALVTAALPAKKVGSGARRRRAFRERTLSAYYSQYARHDQRLIEVARDGLDSTTVETSVTRLDTDLDVTVRGSWSFAKTAVRASGGYSSTLAEAWTGTLRMKNLYLDAEGTGVPLRARIGRQSRNRGGIYGRFDGAVLGLRPWSRFGVDVTAGRRVLSTYQSAEDAPIFAGASVSVDLLEDVEAEAHVVEEENTQGTLRRVAGLETRISTPGLSALMQVDYDMAFSRIENARLHLQHRGPGELTLYGTSEVQRTPKLDLERLALEDPLFDPALLDPEEIYYYATRDAELITNISGGVRGEAVGGFRYDISAASTKAPGSEGDEWAHRMTFQLNTDMFGAAGNGGTTLTVGERGDEQRAAFQLYVTRNVGNWSLRPRLRLDYVRTTDVSELQRYTVTPLLRLDYRGRLARYELQAGASFGDSTSADRTARELGYYLTIGYRLTF
jgi:hypothetical protein